jgi:fructose-1,6-bisphosphatase-3
MNMTEARHLDLNSPDYEQAVLRPLSRQFPNVDSASAEIARLSAELTLPKGTIHIISDVHGEDKKLRHIINNASGALRPLVEKLFKSRLEPKQFQEFLNLIFYPAEVVERLEQQLKDPQELRTFAQRVLRDLFEIVRVLASRYSLRHASSVFPPEYAALLAEILHEPTSDHGSAYVAAIIDELVKRGRVLHLIHLTGRVIRNLAVNELILAGDCWDRGPRGDRVVDYLLHQPNVSFVWGNHDAAWMGACKGHEALIAHVIRISLRYRRLSQLEEGYGITLQPLEYLVREVYSEDPAECFDVKGTGLRETITMKRMQKAVAVMQFKLEGQMIARHPEWKMDHRCLLHRLDLKAGTLELDGTLYPIKDRAFPTIDPANPYALSLEEAKCMERLKQSFLRSRKLWEHVHALVRQGRMYLTRDDHLIFHGCIPVDEQGESLLMEIDGNPCGGKELFDAIETLVVRAVDKKELKDLDMLWYLWSGPRSPLFGKDRIATLEMYLVDDKATHIETKNPYFNLIHDKDFCEKILAEFGVNPEYGLIVNGHVPVKIEKGENPLKKSGKAITIDGAFSEAYGDHGYTLVLEPDQTYLAKHYHFESVDAAIRDGIDIIPEVTKIRQWAQTRRVSHTERGQQIRCEMDLMERLIAAYQHHRLREMFPSDDRARKPV